VPVTFYVSMRVTYEPLLSSLTHRPDPTAAPMARGSRDPWWEGGGQDRWGSHDWRDRQRRGSGDQWLDPGAQWRGGRQQKQRPEPLYLPEHVFMVDIPINMHDMPTGWWDSMKALATEFGCKVSWRAKRRWSSEPIYTLTAMGQQGMQVLEEVLGALFRDFPDIDDKKKSAPNQQLAENVKIVEHIIGGLVTEQAQLQSAGPLVLQSAWATRTQEQPRRRDPVRLQPRPPSPTLADAGTQTLPDKAFEPDVMPMQTEPDVVQTEPDVVQTEASQSSAAKWLGVGQGDDRRLTRSGGEESASFADDRGLTRSGGQEAASFDDDDEVMSRGASALRELTAIEPQLPPIVLQTAYKPPNHERKDKFCVTHLKGQAQLRNVLVINVALTWKYRNHMDCRGLFPSVTTMTLKSSCSRMHPRLLR